MAKEVIQKPYYEGYTSYESQINTPFIDIHQSVKICLNAFLANLLFKGDLKRVIYSKTDIAFRRRIELEDKGKVENQEYNPVSLNLPFANFFQSSDWETDDRQFVKNASQAIFGLYDLNTYRRIRSIPVMCKYNATVYLNRHDDVRLVQQLFFQEKSPGTDIRLYAKYGWKGQTLLIPVFTRITAINTKPDYAQKDWLEKQRIFPVEIEFTIRSYQIRLPNINNIINLPIRFMTYNTEDENDIVYLTEQTSLEFAAQRWNLDIDENKVDTEDKDLNLYAEKYFSSKEYTEQQLKALAKEIPNQTTYDIIKGYLTESTETTLNAYYYDETRSTDTKAYINFQIKKADRQYFDHLDVIIPGHNKITVTDCNAKEIIIDNLYPNSTYNCQLLVYSINGDVCTYELSFTTKEDVKDEAPTVKKINSKFPGLVGMSW